MRFFILWFLSMELALAAIAAPEAEDFQGKYLQGKELFKSEKFTQAMVVFLPLTKEADGNNFVQYSQYFYALSAFKASKMDDAYQMLLQLIQKYPQWNNIDEAYYLAANTAFELKKYRYGLNFLKDHADKLKDDTDALKENYFTKLYPIDSLKTIQKAYSNDPVIAKVLVNRLLAGPASEKDRMLANYLIQEYKIVPSVPAIDRRSVLKDSYNVAVLFPFMLNEMGTEGNTARTNNYIHELYQGIQVAVDSLRIRNKIKINLFAYDTEKELYKINEVLKYSELKSMDMIIGPVVPAHNSLVNDFARSNRIIAINPLSNNSKLLDEAGLVYLFQSSLESQALQVASYVTTALPPAEKNKVVVLYGSSNRDSLLALSYRDSLTPRGYKIFMFEQLTKDKLSKVNAALSDSASVSELNHVFVASTDQTGAANIISALEKSKLQVPVFVRAEWLQFPLLSFEQLEKRQVHFLYPDYVEPKHPAATAIKKYFTSRIHTFPTSFVFSGYEMMSFFGKALGQYGNFFKEGLSRQGFVKGNLFAGYDYSFSNDNAYLPITTLDEGKMRVVNGVQVNNEK